MDGIYWETFYNGDKIPDDQTGYIFFENKLLGVPRIRQVKVRNDSCVVHRDFADDIKEFGFRSVRIFVRIAQTRVPTNGSEITTVCLLICLAK